MAHIDYFFATISPFTYLSGTRPAEIAEKHGATITYKPLDIMGLFARTGGIPPGIFRVRNTDCRKYHAVLHVQANRSIQNLRFGRPIRHRRLTRSLRRNRPGAATLQNWLRPSLPPAGLKKKMWRKMT